MSPIGDISGTSRSLVQVAVSRALSAQKMNVHSGLHGDSGDDSHGRQNSHRAINHDGMHRSGTAETVPFQYTTRLVSPFVAQLLGQLMTDPEQPGSGARAAYGNTERNASLLLDASL